MPMDFREASTRVTDHVTLADIAREAGVSHGLIRLARLSPDASAYRAPPLSWRDIVLRLARQQEAHFRRLAEELQDPSHP